MTSKVTIHLLIRDEREEPAMSLADGRGGHRPWMQACDPERPYDYGVGGDAATGSPYATTCPECLRWVIAHTEEFAEVAANAQTRNLLVRHAQKKLAELSKET